MSLTPNQIGLVRQSFDALKKNPKRWSVEFYERFFEKAPEARSLFRDDLEGQGMRFMTTLSMIVAHLDRADGIEERLKDLGGAHRALGVTAAQFEPMGAALVDTLAAALGEKFTPEMRAAWDAGYIEIAAMVIEKGGIEA